MSAPIEIPKEEFRKIVDERRDLDMANYERRDDKRNEGQLWRDVFFACYYEEKIEGHKLQRGYDVADLVLEEYRKRFS